jgi:hypothetical protein
VSEGKTQRNLIQINEERASQHLTAHNETCREGGILTLSVSTDYMP